MDKIVGFLTIEEMNDSASKIGDVTTPEGKDKMLDFLAKGFKTIEDCPEAREAFVDSFFIKYMTKCQVNGSYYFENGKLKAGLDYGDAIVGNAIEHFDFLVDIGDTVMRRISEYNGCTYRDYSPEERQRIQDSCASYNIKGDSK